MPKKMIAVLMFGFLTLLAEGCSTPMYRAFEQINIGDDKFDVLERLGNPKHSLRTDGKDVWVYRYFNENEEYKRTLIFESGKLSKMGPETPFKDEKEIQIDLELESMGVPQEETN